MNITLTEQETKIIIKWIDNYIKDRTKAKIIPDINNVISIITKIQKGHSFDERDRWEWLRNWFKDTAIGNFIGNAIIELEKEDKLTEDELNIIITALNNNPYESYDPRHAAWCEAVAATIKLMKSND